MQEQKQILKHLESPFDFIKGFHIEQKRLHSEEDRKEKLEERKKDELKNYELHPDLEKRMEGFQEQEKEVEVRVDAVSTHIAKSLGYTDVPWFRLTWYLLWIYTILTILIMMKREDFINMTICTCALYVMFNAEKISRTMFRLLVCTIIFSLIYDLIWFILKHIEFSESQKADGGMENSLRRFVLLLSYISFIVRVSSYL